RRSSYDIMLHADDHKLRPILRGQRRYVEGAEFAFQLDVLDEGVVDLWVRNKIEHGWHLHSAWMLAAYVVVLRLTQFIRDLAQAREWEFGIELSLDGISPPTMGMTASAGFVPVQFRRLPAIRIGALGAGLHVLTELPLRLPRVPSRLDKDTSALLSTLLQDLLDAAGERRAMPSLSLLE